MEWAEQAYLQGLNKNPCTTLIHPLPTMQALLVDATSMAFELFFAHLKNISDFVGAVSKIFLSLQRESKGTQRN